MQATVAVLKQVVASRYGGLRTPSETLSLRWEDIDWEMNRMSIPEPKVEHHEGRGIRSCPIFSELRPILDEACEIFGHSRTKNKSGSAGIVYNHGSLCGEGVQQAEDDRNAHRDRSNGGFCVQVTSG
jgi:integrase